MTKLSERFLLIDPTSTQMSGQLKFFKRNTMIKKKVSEFAVIIAYNCSDSNCFINSEDEAELNYALEIQYDAYKINHQETYNHLQNERISCFIPFFSNNTLLVFLNWEDIIYQQKIKGIDLVRDLEKKKL